jgi:hypothetical protein
MGKKFELIRNHFRLKHLFGQPTLNVIKTRWLEFLSECEFDIKHIKGKEKQVANALNRRAHEVHVVSIIMYMTDMNDTIIEDANSDQHYVKIK